MIPKTLHYCWFGKGELPPLAQRCIASWRQIMPEYRIKCWNEDAIDMDDPFVQRCIEHRKWAFLSDRIRFDALFAEGGIYLDVDVEAVRPFDPLLQNGFFAGWECPDFINAAVVGARAASPLCRQLGRLVEQSVLRDERFVAVPRLITPCLSELKPAPGELSIYPPAFFYPYNPYDKSRPVNQLMAGDITDATYAIHHWQKAWSSGKKARRGLIGRLREEAAQLFRVRPQG